MSSSAIDSARVDLLAVALVLEGHVPPADLACDPLTQLCRPVTWRGWPGKLGVGRTGSRRNVTNYPQVGTTVPAYRGGVQINLNDCRAGSDQGPVTHRPHVERAAPAHDQVGAPDQFGGEG
jgi:hypothetical protein